MKPFHNLLNNLVTIVAPDRRVFAIIPMGFAHRTLPVRSRAFRDWFYAQVWNRHEIVPTGQAWGAICRNLEAQAVSDRDRSNIIVGCRVGPSFRDGRLAKVLLDLASPNREFVEITTDQWTITCSSSAVHFEEMPFAAKLAKPTPADSAEPHPLDRLAAILRLDRPLFLRCLAWLLSVLHPESPHPILMLRGPAGSGKSAAARILRGLVDPSTSRFAPTPSTHRQLTDIALQNYVLAFDHVSSLSPRIADGLCRISTGAAILHRQPGHSEPTQLWTRRPILLTVTDDFTPPSCLAGRALTVAVPPLAPESRRTEAALVEEVHLLTPAVLAVLCDAVSAALRDQAPVEPHPTRHTDALAWTLAAAPVLRCTPGEIREALQPDPNPIVQALQRLLSGNSQWSGTAAELSAIFPIASDPRSLACRLQKNAQALVEAGITIHHRRGHEGRRILEILRLPSAQPTELIADS